MVILDKALSSLPSIQKSTSGFGFVPFLLSTLSSRALRLARPAEDESQRLALGLDSRRCLSIRVSKLALNAKAAARNNLVGAGRLRS